MAIALDTSGGFAIVSGGSTVDLTLAAGATCLVASCYYNNNGSGTVTATWNGVAMTLVGYVNFNNSITQLTAGLQNVLFYLLNPDTGLHTLSVTDNQTRPLGVSASSYTGVVTIGTNGHNGSTTAGTLTNTLNVAQDSWIVMGGTGNSTMAAGTGFTARNTQNAFQCAIGDSNAALNAGNNSISLTNSSNNGIASFAVELQIAATATKFLTLLGIGT